MVDCHQPRRKFYSNSSRAQGCRHGHLAEGEGHGRFCHNVLVDLPRKPPCVLKRTVLTVMQLRSFTSFSSCIHMLRISVKDPIVPCLSLDQLGLPMRPFNLHRP